MPSDDFYGRKHEFHVIDDENYDPDDDYAPDDLGGDDRPDVEFNDDGSVHINTPGDYYISYNSADLRQLAIYHDGRRIGWRDAAGNWQPV